MKKYRALIRAGWMGVTLLGASGVFAQSDSTTLLPWKLHLQSRFSLVEGSLIGLWGASVGYVWGPYEREITLGYQWLGGRGSRQLGHIEKKLAQNIGLDSYNATEAGFVSLGYWHIVHNSQRWKMGFPIELGLGRATARLQSLTDDQRLGPDFTSSIVPLQVGAYAEWKATRWVGIGLQAGYRQNLSRFVPVDNLNGPYGRFRILVYPATYREWWRFVFKGQPLPSPFYRKRVPGSIRR